MKAIVTAIACSYFAAHAFAAAPLMTKDEVLQLGKRILQTKEERYRKNVRAERPVYYPKEGVWHFDPIGAPGGSFPDAPMYFFEIRDSDGSHRIGMLTYESGYVPRSSQYFKPSPGMKRRAAMNNKK